MLTKAQVRTAVRQMIDDPNSKRWSDPALDQLIELVLDDIYGDILDVAPYFNSQYQQIPTLHAPGYIDLRQTIYGGDLTQRLYRVQQVIANQRMYVLKDPRDYLLIAQQTTGNISDVSDVQGVAQQYSMEFLGNQLWLHPLSTTTSAEIRYNYKPTAFTSLTNGSIVDMPEGSYRGLINLSAAEALPKGNAEEAQQFREMGNDAMTKCLNSIRRQYHGMTVMFAGDSPTSWGGV